MVVTCRLGERRELLNMSGFQSPAVIPADAIHGFAEGVEGKHREGGEHRQHDVPACLRGQAVQIAFEPCRQHFLPVVELPVCAPHSFSDTFSFHAC